MYRDEPWLINLVAECVGMHACGCKWGASLICGKSKAGLHMSGTRLWGCLARFERWQWHGPSPWPTWCTLAKAVSVGKCYGCWMGLHVNWMGNWRHPSVSIAKQLTCRYGLGCASSVESLLWQKVGSRGSYTAKCWCKYKKNRN